MTKQSWFRIAFENVRTHAVSQSLLGSLITDMIKRGHPIDNYEKSYGVERAKALQGNPALITEWAFDVGGYYVVEMPIETIEVEGLSVQIPCDMFDAIARTFAKAQPRRFDDGASYFKMKFWLHATVLTVSQYTRLRREIEARVDAALTKAQTFLSERRENRATPT
jgi:hypothetical protein